MSSKEKETKIMEPIYEEPKFTVIDISTKDVIANSSGNAQLPDDEFGDNGGGNAALPDDEF